MNCLQNQWYKLSLWHLLLIPISWVFWLLVVIRKSFYKIGFFKSFKLGVPVIVVGNITVGGTGKTPLVIWLAERLKESGFTPGIISRGYGGVSGEKIIEVSEESDPFLVGDEPVLLSSKTRCPVYVGRKKGLVAQALLRDHPECDILLSDDGLQHYALSRDYEIAVVDATRNYGNGFLLPAGPLREPLSRLGFVDSIVYNGSLSNSAQIAMNLNGQLFHNLKHPEIVVEAGYFEGKSTHVVAGIGNPDRFFKKLEDLGLQFERHVFPDHYLFKPGDLQIPDAQAILMTEKDAVKCKKFAQDNFWSLSAYPDVDMELLNRIMRSIRK